MENHSFDVGQYWQAVARQDKDALAAYFWADAKIYWHCTNEAFSLDGFLRANCEYPGQWAAQVGRVHWMGDSLVAAAHVYALDGPLSCHVVSFFKLEGGKILQLDEYWGDDGPPPAWRQGMQISRRFL